MEKKYLTLYRTVKDKILSGEYKSGEKLPSKRVMADKSGCSVITVETAYNMLSDEGYIAPMERCGYYVCELDLFPAAAKKTSVLKYLSDDIEEIQKNDFEYSVWFKTIRKVISEKGDELFIKSPGKGCAILRNAIADFLLRYRGMIAEPERIIIGSGA